MPIEHHLAEGERVLAACREFYATDRRLLRYAPGEGEDRVESLDYGEISQVRPAMRPHMPFLVAGLVIVALGVFVPDATLGFLLLLIGLVVVMVGFFRRTTYFEFRSSSLSRAQQARWRLHDIRDEAARQFIGVVLGQIRSRKAPEGNA